MTDDEPIVFSPPPKPCGDCPKCGSSTAALRWCLGRGTGSACSCRGEHLHVDCRRCGYTWTTPCLDAPKEEATTAGQWCKDHGVALRNCRHGQETP